MNESRAVSGINEIKQTGLYIMGPSMSPDTKYAVCTIYEDKTQASTLLVYDLKGNVQQYLLVDNEWDLCYEEYQTDEYGVRTGELRRPGTKINIRGQKKVNGVWPKMWHPVFGEDVAKAKRARELAVEAGMEEEKFNAILLAVKECLL